MTNNYDRPGRKKSVVCGGTTTSFIYDLANDVLSETNSGGALSGLMVSNQFDSYLRRTDVALWKGSTALCQGIYGYDNASRLATLSDGSGNSAAYSYLANSPLVGQITFKRGSTTEMTTSKQYDFLNRLSSVSSTPSSAFAYQYNAANQRTRNQLWDGSYWRYGYDGLGQVTNCNKYWVDQTPVAGQQFYYAFDTIGNRTQTQAGGDQNGANLRVAAYTNNTLNQITGRGVPGYVDIMGNALATNSVTVNGLTAYRKVDYFRQQVSLTNTNGAVWQGVTNASTGQASVTGHLFVPSASEWYTYDADGNLLYDGRWHYYWDAENRLSRLASLSGDPAGSQLELTFSYDYQGRRIQKVVLTNYNGNYYGEYTNNYAYDGWNCLALLNPSLILSNSFLWGSDLSGSLQGAGGVGGLIQVTYYGGTTTNCFVAYDGNGNVSALVNAADGTTAASYDYGPFGEVIRATGPMAKLNPFTFQTEVYDWETDKYYWKNRFYDPSPGRWLSRDPAEEDGGPNLYGFVGNDPIDYWDYLGFVWSVTRTGSPRAVACCDCGDTVAQLAAKIHLDPGDYQKWLMAVGGAALPATANTPISPGACFTIPNKVYVNDLLPWYYPLWKEWKIAEIRDLNHEGYDVIPVRDTLNAAFLAQVADPNVQGIDVIAHGDENAKGDFSDASPTAPSLPPGQAAAVLHHKLAGFKAIWCWSGVKSRVISSDFLASVVLPSLAISIKSE